MEKNNVSSLKMNIFMECLFILLSGACMFGLAMLKVQTIDRCVMMAIFVAAGIAVIGYCFRSALIHNRLDYNNGFHVLRFWFCVLIGLCGSILCIYLPESGWPFVAIYVLFSLYSNLTTGVIAGSVFLFIPILMNGIAVPYFFVYFISGVFAASLFQKLENGFKIVLPMLLSVICLFLTECVQEVLLVNARPGVELFAVPFLNAFINGVLLIVILRIFSSFVVYKDHNRYLDLNDTENESLKELKANHKDDYYISVHTAYFCERIATKLHLSEEVMKCVAYYHKMGEKLPEIMESQKFPENAKVILTEFQGKQYKKLRKETVVLICCDAVINSILFVMAKNTDAKIDYGQIIDAVFLRFYEKNNFAQSDISLEEMNTIRTTFKEEKLYYDFLRR